MLYAAAALTAVTMTVATLIVRHELGRSADDYLYTMTTAGQGSAHLPIWLSTGYYVDLVLTVSLAVVAAAIALLVRRPSYGMQMTGRWAVGVIPLAVLWILISSPELRWAAPDPSEGFLADDFYRPESNQPDDPRWANFLQERL
ncbi:hypothetical protein Ahu01nite_080440 [Winogradskya humida]|uniref:Uncharacterized protein n=2 Tax=Winogradskya humida TaxID=113566 RepID=A0ABQ4A289_9ACTN|nr:hypothetical protein Ahu01nite_080440 [Actinoplanes humidus]